MKSFCTTPLTRVPLLLRSVAGGIAPTAKGVALLGGHIGLGDLEAGLGGHGLRGILLSVVCVKGHGVGDLCPLGVEGDILLQHYILARSIPLAGAILLGIPTHKGVVGSGKRVSEASR